MEPSSADSTPLLQPEVLQAYLQLLTQQAEADGGGGGGASGGGEGETASNLVATSTLLQQVSNDSSPVTERVVFGGLEDLAL